jgi:predicted DNA-binding transcriptional regulator YafY
MQINRLFEIVYILINKKTVTAKELAEKFEVSTRTIYRDIENLSSVGIPVYMSKGKNGGISILSDFVLNKTVLTEEERSNILSSMKALQAVDCNSSETALEKLSSLFGDETLDWIEVDFSSWYQGDKESKIFSQIKSAILSKNRISFTYSSVKGEKIERVVEPLRLCFKGTSRYLYGYCMLRKDYRFFKLSRIHHLVICTEHFDRTVKGPLFQESSVASKAPEAYMQIKLKISPKLAFRVYDEFDCYERTSDGSFIVQTEFPQNEMILPYIISFGSGCEVLEPDSLREAIKKELKECMKLYL